MSLAPISMEKYMEFCHHHFAAANKTIDDGVVENVYARFNGTTSYLQKIMNIMFSMTPQKGICRIQDVDIAINTLLDLSSDTYESLLYQMPEKQRTVFTAIASEGEAKSIAGGAFVKKHHLHSASSVMSAIKGLLEKDFITEDKGVYRVYDYFFQIWLMRNKM